MSKKILIVNSSPRKHGNTSTLSAWVRDGAQAAGAEVTVIDLPRLENKTHGCIACMQCRPNLLRCAVDDEISDLLEIIGEGRYEVLVIATPIYFFNLNAQAKAFIDRFLSLVPSEDGVASPLAKIQFALVATGGGDEKDSGVEVAKLSLEHLTSYVGAPKLKTLFQKHCTEVVELLAENAVARQKAVDFGRSLAR